MRLAYRITKPSDLCQCLALTRNHFVFQPSEHASLISMWECLINRRMAVSAVVVDTDRPIGQEIVGFGMSVFPTNQFADEARYLPTYHCRSIFELWQNGETPLPLLNANQIRAANSSEGLNVAVIHRGWRNAHNGLAADELAIAPKLYESFMALHVGYSLNKIQVEVYGDYDKQRLANFGYYCETDYSHCDKLAQNSPSDLRPYLMAVTAQQVLQQPFYTMTPLFVRRQPTMGFSASQQALLQEALISDNDREAATNLDISVSTVHKRWRAIFERASVNNPSLLGPTNERVRGHQKRRLLLRYIKDHPQELRPFARPNKNGG